MYGGGRAMWYPLLIEDLPFLTANLKHISLARLCRFQSTFPVADSLYTVDASNYCCCLGRLIASCTH
jgi:hypothetical protein